MALAKVGVALVVGVSVGVALVGVARSSEGVVRVRVEVS